MARIKGGLNAKKKHNRVLKLAKGYRGARSKQYRVAKQSVMRALTSSYAGRKQRKASVPSAVDRSYQRCCKNERPFLQQASCMA
jgi:ribosomal protein L20